MRFVFPLGIILTCTRILTVFGFVQNTSSTFLRRGSLASSFLTKVSSSPLKFSSSVLAAHFSTRSSQSINMSTAELIDGNAIAAQIRVELKDSVRVLQETLGVTPGLAVVLVGARRDSATYVRMKKKACAEIGINSYGFDFSADITEAELLAKVDELNEGRIKGCLLVQYWLTWLISMSSTTSHIFRSQRERHLGAVAPACTH